MFTEQRQHVDVMKLLY